MSSLSRSLSVSMVIRFPLSNVRSKCECVHTMRVGMVLLVRPYVHHIYIIYSDKHTSTREALQISPPNLLEGGSLHSPIRTTLEFISSDYCGPYDFKIINEMEFEQINF